MEIGTCEAEASEQWDYVLVAHHRTQGDPRQEQFLEELRRKGFHIKPQTIQDQKRVFFGIRADSRIFDLYRTLLLEPEGPAPHTELAAPTPVPVTTSPPAREGASKPGPPCPHDLPSPVQAPQGSARACFVDRPRTLLAVVTRQWRGQRIREQRAVGLRGSPGGIKEGEVA
uniref:anoctamin-9-like n=1 Tax=Macaca mulatta TaxID=9544 RepID=UPI0010A202FB|nr:anoctamin-9-like [Macaca mulatta]